MFFLTTRCILQHFKSYRKCGNKKEQKKAVRRMLYASDLRVIHIFVCNKLCTCFNFLFKTNSQLFLTKINFLKKITVNSLRSFTCDVHKKIGFWTAEYIQDADLGFKIYKNLSPFSTKITANALV